MAIIRPRWDRSDRVTPSSGQACALSDEYNTNVCYDIATLEVRANRSPLDVFFFLTSAETPRLPGAEGGAGCYFVARVAIRSLKASMSALAAARAAALTNRLALAGPAAA